VGPWSPFRMAAGYVASSCRRSLAVGGPGVDRVGSATPLPVLGTWCQPARPSSRCQVAWLTEGWSAAGVGEPNSFGSGSVEVWKESVSLDVKRAFPFRLDGRR
jgi:hypothetical protein